MNFKWWTHKSVIYRKHFVTIYGTLVKSKYIGLQLSIFLNKTMNGNIVLNYTIQKILEIVVKNEEVMK